LEKEKGKEYAIELRDSRDAQLTEIKEISV
jgi:hypothetical protein